MSANTTRLSFGTDAIRRAWPITKWLQSRDIALRQDAKRWRCICPIHRGENKSAFVVQPDGMAWFCHRCGEGGDIIRLVQMVDDLSFENACVLLGGTRDQRQVAPQRRQSAPPNPPKSMNTPPVLLPELGPDQRHEMRALWERLANDRGLIRDIAESRSWEPVTIESLAWPITNTSPCGCLGWIDGRSQDTGLLCFLFPHAVKTRQLFRDAAAPGGWRWHLDDGRKITRWLWKDWPWNACELWREDRINTSPIRKQCCFLTEGEPDAISAIDDYMESTFRTVLAIPSASMGQTLKARLPSILQGMDIIYAADADRAGQRAAAEITGLLRGTSKSFRILDPTQLT